MKGILAITLLLLGSFTLASAQRNPQICATRSFTFRCPVDSTVLLSGRTDGLFVAKGDPPQEIGIFASEIADAPADEKLLMDLLDRTFQLLYSRRATDFQFKESREARHLPEWRYSSFEEMRYQKVAFDPVRSELRHMHAVVLRVEGKRILVGFVRTFLNGSIAKTHFEGWTMGSGSGPGELRRVLHSLTKEDNQGGRRRVLKPAAASTRPK
jgi:hypothetical protein